MTRLLLLIFLGCSSVSVAQTDTLTIVSYNLLNFPDGRDDCGSNTVVPDRADTLRKILTFAKPDIFVACEIQTEDGADSILTRALNTNGMTNYAAASYHESTFGGALNNMLYYNSDKLTLQWQDYIQTNPRDIDHYVLYVNDPNLGTFYDTTFIEVYMCHLKAGNSGTNEALRAEQTQLLMDYIATRPSDRNHFVCGDLNVYSSNEQGYQQLVSGQTPLIDPINSPGNWNNNSSFAALHTQSTRSGTNLDCGSTGGSDDRFDQILVSSNVMSGSDSLRYLANSYIALGNDGNHFNTSLIANPTNAQYPDSIVRALYYMSDHLPVVLKSVVTYPTSNGLALYPIVNGVDCYGAADGSATIVANDGQPPYSYLWDSNTGNQTTAQATGLISGSYCVQVTDALGEIDDYCVYISQPDSIFASVFITPESGVCNGVAHILLSGGVVPYSITWNDPLSQVGQSAYDLCEGQYEATIIDANNCTTTVQVIIGTTGINQLDDGFLSLYPNPVVQKLQLTFKDINGPIQINISDQSGRLVYSEFKHEVGLQKHTIDLENLKQGMYTIEVHQNDKILRKNLLKSNF